ncbi:hypothetical protein [Hydrogenophaga sp.]|uniref:hypothetical protein n=1 Tax=Hydrogenophaga sp. TaxID=1904254 RepID=UPI0019C41F8D|nr:hypothetical protein [Hydrogenophaga sp.]MBD3892612.1 hypothetical protein [Hydrogenophaga sp.]
MLFHENKTMRRWAHLLGACALVATLSACGGGGGDAPPAAPAQPAVAAPATNPSTGFTQTGNLNYLVTSADGSTRTVAATVVANAPQGTLTLHADTANPFPISTTNNWASVTWPAGFAGALRAQGNAILVCATATNASQVGVSHNMTLVPNPVAALSGVTVRISECYRGRVKSTDFIRFNENGTATFNPGTINSETMPAAMVNALFSPEGLAEADGSSSKAGLYSIVIDGRTQFHLVRSGRDNLGDGTFFNSVMLASSVN